MTTDRIRLLIEKYSRLNDKELSRQFVEHNKLALKFWDCIDDDTANEHEILSEIIIERFVAQSRIGEVWSVTRQDWVRG